MQLVSAYNQKEYMEHTMLVKVLQDFVEFRRNHNPDKDISSINCDDCEVVQYCPLCGDDYKLQYNMNDPNVWRICFEAYRRYVEKCYAQQLHIGPSAPISNRLENYK